MIALLAVAVVLPFALGRFWVLPSTVLRILGSGVLPIHRD
jgi:hypothetical protein